MAHSRRFIVAEEFFQKDVLQAHRISNHETEPGEGLFSVGFLHCIHLEDCNPGNASPTVGRSYHLN